MRIYRPLVSFTLACLCHAPVLAHADPPIPASSPAPVSGAFVGGIALAAGGGATILTGILICMEGTAASIDGPSSEGSQAEATGKTLIGFGIAAVMGGALLAAMHAEGGAKKAQVARFLPRASLAGEPAAMESRALLSPPRSTVVPAFSYSF